MSFTSIDLLGSMKKTALVNCMEGIGDQIYMRPYIRLLTETHKVYVKTVMPELFMDLEVNFVERPDSIYRTQLKNKSTRAKFSKEPSSYDVTINTNYSAAALEKFSIVSHFEHIFGFELGSSNPVYDLPYLPPHNLVIPSDKKLAIIRPVTYRKEWLCSSRAPKPEYIAWCTRELRAAGYYTISVADTDDVNEWIPGEIPDADLKLHRGELDIYQTLSLMSESDIVVGGSGFIIPAVMSMKKPSLFIIFGGRGLYDNPHKVFSFKADMSKIGWSTPNKFCRCSMMEHNCDKSISDLDTQFYKFLKEQNARNFS